MTDELTIEQQATLARDFVEDVVDAFGYDADVDTASTDDDIEVAVTGGDLGLLIGPKGQTLQALQELTRTVVQRHMTARTARLHVDVAGYREKRRAALERFVRQVAEEVRTSGERRALEPMSPADRKIVHDAVNDIDGVSSVSEGEDTRRRVVLVPDAAAGAADD